MDITFTPELQSKLESEAAREIPRERIIMESLKAYFLRVQSPSLEYDAFFRAKYEERLATYRSGKTHFTHYPLHAWRETLSPFMTHKTRAALPTTVFTA